MYHVFVFRLALEASDLKFFKLHTNKKARVEFHTGLFRNKNLLKGSYYFAAGAAGAGAAGACIIGAEPYP